MRTRLTLLMLFVLGLLFTSQLQPAPDLLAQSGGAYVLTLSTATAGGTAVAGTYQMDVVIGQAEAGLQTGGDYELGGGFWGGGPSSIFVALFEVYLPMIVR